MRNLKVMYSAAALMVAMAWPAGADTQQSAASRVPARNQNATIIAKHLKCGGPDLDCGSVMVRICNPKNNKCCCASAGIYH
jgi:hypothetical protein